MNTTTHPALSSLLRTGEQLRAAGYLKQTRDNLLEAMTDLEVKRDSSYPEMPLACAVSLH